MTMTLLAHHSETGIVPISPDIALAPDHPPRLSPLVARHTGKVLVLDRDPVIRQHLSDALRRCGVLAWATSDAREAVAIIVRERIDVLVLDLVLPGASGADVIHALRQDAVPIQIVIFSAFASERAVQAGQAVADIYLTKPVLVRMVLQHIAMLLRVRPAVEDLAANIQGGEARSLANGMPMPVTPLLIVDDDMGIRHFLRRFFEDTYPIYEARDGREGLHIMRTFSERMIVLLDRMMPRLDGVGVLRAVAEDPDLAYRHAYLLVTARTDPPPPEIDLIMAQLRVPIIPKPVNLDALQVTVRNAAERMYY